jgi:RhoGEF domain/PH domain
LLDGYDDGRDQQKEKEKEQEEQSGEEKEKESGDGSAGDDDDDDKFDTMVCQVDNPGGGPAFGSMSPVLARGGAKKKSGRTKLETSLFAPPSMETIKIRDQQRTVSRERRLVEDEVVSTERSYVESLRIVVANFLVPIRERVDELRVAADDVPKVFGNIEAILALAERMLEAVAEQQERARADKPYSMSTVMCELIPSLRIYAEYVSNLDEQARALNRWMQREQFVRFAEQQLASIDSPSCGYNKNVGLPNFLIMPVQRIPRYVLLLEELLKHTDVLHPDWETTRRGVELMRKMADSVNVSLSQEEHAAKLADVAKEFGEADDTLLRLTTDDAAPTRKYVREGYLRRFWAVPDARRITIRNYFFLLSDKLVVGEPVADDNRLVNLRRKTAKNYDLVKVFPLQRAVSVKDRSLSVSEVAQLEKTAAASMAFSDDDDYAGAGSPSSGGSAAAADDPDDFVVPRHCFAVTFVVKNNSEREFLFAARSSFEKDEWIRDIGLQIARYVREGTQYRPPDGSGSNASSSSSSSSSTTAPATAAAGSPERSGDASEQQVVKRGFLHKRGDKIHSWKHRFFALKGAKLYYYTSARDSTPLGHVVLEHYDLVALPAEKFERPFCFALESSSGGRHWYLQASGPVEFKSWIHHLGPFVHADKTAGQDLEHRSIVSSSPSRS